MAYNFLFVFLKEFDLMFISEMQIFTRVVRRVKPFPFGGTTCRIRNDQELFFASLFSFCQNIT